MSRTPTKSLSQLQFERQWLATKLSARSVVLTELEKIEIMSKLESLDLLLAATPAQTLQDLLIKLEEFARACYPSDGMPDEETPDGVLFSAILADARDLSAREIR